jgi:hypothetical protein
MNHEKKRNLYLILGFFIFMAFLNQASGQDNSISDFSIIGKSSVAPQDTAREIRKRNALISEPDTNFTWEKYADFLIKISDTSKYVVLPLNEFRQTFNPGKVVIGLRHDVDNDLNVAYNFSEIESKLGYRSTYFILHTAPYYLANPNNMAIHSEAIIPILKTMQNIRKFEIGWHNDLVTLQLIYGIDPVKFLHDELAWLRGNGISISGTAAHGSNYCKVYHYMNFYFFNECTFPVVPDRENNMIVPIGGFPVPIMKANLSDFDLKYEAYFLNNNKAYSDATITNGVRWDIGMLDLNSLHAGDRAIILLHPIHWHKGSTSAEIVSFKIDGQLSSVIDPVKSEISVEMPYGSIWNSLKANFSLSQGAYAKVSGKLQVNGSTINDFSQPVTYRVFAENRSVQREWVVKVHNGKNGSCEFKSFFFPGLTKSVLINTIDKTVLIKISEVADLTSLTPVFELSAGATAWIAGILQQSNSGTLNFKNGVEYKVIGENGSSSCKWYITVIKEKNHANFLSFSFPGLIGTARIDTITNSIDAEINPAANLKSLKPVFLLSDSAHAFVARQPQISGVDFNDFTKPVFYDVVSEDSIKVKHWKVSVLQTIVSAESIGADEKHITVYPNPSDGHFGLKFRNLKTFPCFIEIYNFLGSRVYSNTVTKSGDFTTDIDISGLPSGVYILKYSKTEKPAMVIIQKQ